MDQLILAAQQIIKAQQSVIGPIALDQARRVSGLTVHTSNDIVITGNPKKILGELVDKYAEFFGQASVEVCKDAVREVTPPIPSSDLPDILK
ncbi:MAG: hypothetical protein NUV98_00555 [Candidatus Roizmanbacteria bacterium]|nr:hypothetical protein [Candidatus Roizmanbacteria bacterium]